MGLGQIIVEKFYKQFTPYLREDFQNWDELIDKAVKENCKKCEAEKKKKYWRSKYPL
jgi:hypothetical protein